MSEQVHQFGIEDTNEQESSVKDYNTSSNVLDDLRNSLSAPVGTKETVLKVPQRPNIEMVFDPDIEFDLLRAWMRSASNNKKQQFNPLVFAFAVISKTNVGVRISGKQAYDEEGTALTVVHAQFREMLGAHDTASAIRKLYGLDGHIISTGQKIVEDAGYDDVDLEAGNDPLGI